MQKIHQPTWDGILYEAGGRKDKVMTVMSGSDGGLEHAGKLAKYLSDNGIPALALALFHTKHTGKALDRIPVERVGQAITYLKAQGYAQVGIEGISKGAEYALAAAIRYPELGCVIAKTPSYFYSEGLSGGRPSGRSCWTQDDAELPYTPYFQRRFAVPKLLLKAGEYNLLPINTGKNVLPESIIPVEKIQAPILLFSTKADTIWASLESCERLCARLQEKGFFYPYRHICFERMSHMMLENCGRGIRWFFRSEKEYPEVCAQERLEMGQACIDWIENVWQTAPHKEDIE